MHNNRKIENYLLCRVIMTRNRYPKYCITKFAQVVYMLHLGQAWQRQANEFIRIK